MTIRADCPKHSANCRVIGKGKPRRGAKLSSESWEREDGVWVQQLLCKVHGKFRAQPHFLVARKHYVAPIIDDALESRVIPEPIEAVCSRWALYNASTPRRWIRAFNDRLKEVWAAAGRRLGRLRPGWTLRNLPESASLAYSETWELLGVLRVARLDYDGTKTSRAHLALL